MYLQEHIIKYNSLIFLFYEKKYVRGELETLVYFICFVIVLFLIGLPFYILSGKSEKKGNIKNEYSEDNKLSNLINSIDAVKIYSGASHTRNESSSVGVFKKQLLVEKYEPIMNSNKSSVIISEFKAQLTKYNKLFDEGIFNYTEYSNNKEKIINSIKTKEINDSIEDFLLSLIPLLNENILNESDITKIKEIVFNK